MRFGATADPTIWYRTDHKSFFGRTPPEPTSFLPLSTRERGSPALSGAPRKSLHSPFTTVKIISEGISIPDTTNAAAPGVIIGYGGPGSPNTNNRVIQEYTFDWLQTFWKSDRYGALQYYTQYSYVNRAPWFDVPGAPRNAHLSMVYAGFSVCFALDIWQPAQGALSQLKGPFHKREQRIGSTQFRAGWRRLAS